MIVGSRVGEGISGKGYHSMIGLSSMGQGSGQEGSDVAAGAVRVQRLQVPSFISKDGEYLYLLEYTLVNRSKGRVYRSWDDFMEFYNVITQQNPGIVGSMQHKLLNKSGYAFMTDGIASRRRFEQHVTVWVAAAICFWPPDIFQAIPHTERRKHFQISKH
ncbi:hypothetical protein AX774_g5622 [Zancudomyces culisetae]|uniref:PX domain-containing protein n=1 Tax=Zancudomyces culisetae TaxID=1213189 RepID=A0A1R1PIX5_ZANCU|nr:hypothetical protein AX774_g5622 [Zancudomyces culisetae]|eukprot:OMH80934.1 hypothetical protein AX774_g5622 [Zancudomyces culisetae]